MSKASEWAAGDHRWSLHAIILLILAIGSGLLGQNIKIGWEQVRSFEGHTP